MDSYSPTPRTTVHRLAKRAAYDRATVYSILDEALVCHLAIAREGSPVVLPTLFGRKGDTVYVHGSPAAHLLKEMVRGVEVSMAVTLLDGLVLARSAFHHSVNYRSVVLFGTAQVVTDPIEKNDALAVISDHIVPGRWAEVRAPSEKELKGTLVLALPLEEVSAKVRTGPPIDDEEDYAIPVWAGVLPLKLTPGEPLGDGRGPDGIEPSSVVTGWRRP